MVPSVLRALNQKDTRVQRGKKRQNCVECETCFGFGTKSNLPALSEKPPQQELQNEMAKNVNTKFDILWEYLVFGFAFIFV